MEKRFVRSDDEGVMQYEVGNVLGRKAKQKGQCQIAIDNQNSAFHFLFVPRRTMPPKKKLRLVDMLATEPDSKLALHLIRKWSWGLYSAAEVSVLAREALADQKVLLEKVGAPANFASRSLEMLANIGSQGSITKNIYTHTNTNTLIHTHTH